MMNEKTIKMEMVRFYKKGSRWIEESREMENISEKQYINIIEAKTFFRNLGGYERHERNYTKAGYIPTRVSSISPDRQNKTLRIFNFDNFNGSIYVK